MALRERFEEIYDLTLYNQVGLADLEMVTMPVPDTCPNQSSQLQLEDRWALQYVMVPRLRPLLEAMDENFSSFITVKEVNRFTSSRPDHWR